MNRKHQLTTLLEINTDITQQYYKSKRTDELKLQQHTEAAIRRNKILSLFYRRQHL